MVPLLCWSSLRDKKWSSGCRCCYNKCNKAFFCSQGWLDRFVTATSQTYLGCIQKVMFVLIRSNRIGAPICWHLNNWDLICKGREQFFFLGGEEVYSLLISVHLSVKYSSDGFLKDHWLLTPLVCSHCSLYSLAPQLSTARSFHLGAHSSGVGG